MDCQDIACLYALSQCKSRYRCMSDMVGSYHSFLVELIFITHSNSSHA
jgi:hypothetical protein